LTTIYSMRKIDRNERLIDYRIYSQHSTGGLLNMLTADNPRRRFCFTLRRHDGKNSDIH